MGLTRARARAALRALHRTEQEEASEQASPHNGSVEAEGGSLVGRLSNEDVAATTRYRTKRHVDSNEWAESLLRWDGSDPNQTWLAEFHNDADDEAPSPSRELRASLLPRDRFRDSAKRIGNSLKFINAMKKPMPSLPEQLAQPSMHEGRTKWTRRTIQRCKKDAMSMYFMLTSSFMNVLLLFLPFGFAAQYFNWGSTLIFTFNFVALIPLALVLGEVTEDLAMRFGQTVGGLLNATFGNVVEMILSLAALEKGLNDVVAMSLLGSILSNMLLVLGCCFFFGGIKYNTQHFNETATKASTALLFLMCIAIALPTTADHFSDSDPAKEEAEMQNISRATAIILSTMYGCYLFFQLHTHKHLYDSEDEEEDEAQLSLPTAILALAIITITVACCSEFLTGSIQELSKSSGLSRSFIGIILLPIAGNACEHITAVMVAVKNKMDLAIAVAIGSSIQIAIFVVPFVVLVGWAIGHNFTLDFDPFAAIVVTLSVIIANFCSSEGRSTWLTGLLLLFTYLLIATTYLFKQDL